MVIFPRIRLGSCMDIRWISLCCFGVLIIFVATCLMSMPDMTITTDEPGYFDIGKKALFGDLRDVNMQRTPITIINVIVTYVLGYDSIHDRLPLFLTRIPTVFAGALLGFYIALWSKRLYGVVGMFLSLALYAFCPNVIAHSRLITSDMYSALFIFMSVYHFASYLRHGKTPDFILMIFASGLAIVSKQTALLLVFILPLILGINIYFHQQLKGGLGPGKVLAALFCTCFIVNAVYGFRLYSFEIGPLAFAPSVSRCYLPVPQVFVDSLLLGMQYNKIGWNTYLLGQYSAYGWWYYFPVLFLLKMPFSFFLMLAMLILSYRMTTKTIMEDEFLILIPIIVFILFFMFFCKVQIGIRYLLPAFPFLFILMGRLGLYVTLQKKINLKIALIILTASYMVSSLSFFPHFIQYGSEIIYNRINLYKYFSDSNLDWGQSDIYLDRYIAEEKSKQHEIFVNPDQPVNGIVIVNAQKLLDVSNPKRNKYAWLRNNFEPFKHIAYNWLVFDTTGVNVFEND